MENPLVSVIVVNYNGDKYLETCLEALKKQSYPNFEIIVVDNGSSDQSIGILTRRYADTVRLIRNDRNLGFAEGNNIGIGWAKGDYIATLNNDTRATPAWLEELLSAARSNPRIGMCASKILLMNNPGIIDSAGVNIYFDGTSKQREHLQVDSGQYTTAEEILAPSACAALYRRQMLEDTGLFDGDFFAYCEDTDLGLRARLMGWQAVFAPSAVVYHFLSGTAGRLSPLKAYLVERNHFWVALKNFPLKLLFALPFFNLVRLFIQAKSILCLRSKRGSLKNKVYKYRIFLAVLKAHASVLLSLPSIIKKRHMLRRKKILTDSQAYDLLKRFSLKIGDLRLTEIIEG